MAGTEARPTGFKGNLVQDPPSSSYKNFPPSPYWTARSWVFIFCKRDSKDWLLITRANWLL